MGLDMYLVGDDYVPTYAGQTREKRDGYAVSSYRVDMGYWRKHAPLHCYIVNNFADGVDDCREISLSSEKLLQIADALRKNELPIDDDCHGFFFGHPNGWAEDRAAGAEHALVFERAAKWLDRGEWRSVLYQGSW